MSTSPTLDELDRRREAKRAAGQPPDARSVELIAGERVEGIVLRLPIWNAESGTRLFLATVRGTVSIPATANKGHSVLARLLDDERVAVGDRVAVTYMGKRPTADGEREYRHYRLEVDHA